MSALFLLMIPPLALAAYRVLAARRVPRAVAVSGAAAAALGLAVVPAYALRTKPQQGKPTETPVSPIFADTAGGRVELLVDFGDGWSEPIASGGETMRRLAGAGKLTVGPLQSTRPDATLEFAASATRPTRLVVGFGGRTLANVAVRRERTNVTVRVPPGPGPAVLDFDVGSGVMTVPVASVAAVAEPAD